MTKGVNMATTTGRYVQPNRRQGGWDVIEPGRKRASAHTATKAEAIERARAIVRDEGGGEIRIKNEYGKLTDRDTVPAPRSNIVIEHCR
jgi:hypothetical protein